MLRLALVLFLASLLFFFMGFPVTGEILWEAGRLFFFVFIVLAVLALIGGLFYRAPPI